MIIVVGLVVRYSQSIHLGSALYNCSFARSVLIISARIKGGFPSLRLWTPM